VKDEALTHWGAVVPKTKKQLVGYVVRILQVNPLANQLFIASQLLK